METSEYIKNTPESLLGTEIDGYLLESILGYGTYGVVYLARHVMMDRYFAFKILQAEFSEDTGSVNSFFQECKVAAKLEHPHVVQAFKAGRTPEGLCYFVMEYVNGQSIEKIRVNTPEQLSLEFLLNISCQLADALDYAWESCRIIHRDIKPDNLLITAAGQLKLADLGLAGAGSRNVPGEIIATPLYMPPETAMGYGTSDMTGDIYSFGIMFYELSAGIPPFTGSIEALQKAHIEQMPPPLLAANPDMDPELARYIDSLLAKDPAMRPQSWKEVKQFLTAAKERLFDPERYILPAVEEADPEADRKAEKSRRETASWYIVIVFTLVFIIALITTFFLFLVK